MNLGYSSSIRRPAQAKELPLLPDAGIGSNTIVASRATTVVLPEALRKRGIKATPVYETYWRFAAERQAMFYRRLAGERTITQDWILREHRFTNAFRAADRVSQFLIAHVIPESERDVRDIVLRVLLFKIFNRISTWKTLERTVGPIHWRSFKFARYNKALTNLIESGERIYSSAYIMPAPALGHRYKHTNHLALLDALIRGGLAQRLEAASGLANTYQILRDVPSFGPFLAYQYTIDLNYSDIAPFSENEFVMPGPGALDGIRKCFASIDKYEPADIIRMMADIAPDENHRYNTGFVTLWGRQLHLIDCQNLFCEVDKYARLAHPNFSSKSGRSRIKQRFKPNGEPIQYVFPDHWGLGTPGGVFCQLPARTG